MVDVTLNENAQSVSIVLPQVVPLVVELDGGLLRIDSRQDTLVSMARRLPGYIRRNPGVFSAGAKAIRSALAEKAASDVETWPVDDVVVSSLEKQAVLGRKIVLLAEADPVVTEAVAARFPFISQVVAIDGLSRMTEEAKARLLGEKFPAGFNLAGRPAEIADAQVHARIDEAVQSPLESRAAKLSALALPSAAINLRALVKCMRLHQWAKNVLIFLPAVLDGKASDMAAWMAAAVGFIALGLVASATYIVNDIWDLADDRRHWSKRQRPLASGDVPISHALLLAVVLVVIGFGLAVAVNWNSVFLLGLYAAVTLNYTFGLKRIPILDVMILAGLFTLRLGLGMALTQASLSHWLLVFSMFVFTSLSAAKRHTEVRRQIEKGVNENGRGYLPADLPLILGFGLASMFAALLISVLYLIEDAFPSGFYSSPVYLWCVPILLSLFLGRIWLLSQRGVLRDDPVEFAVFDRVSLVLGALMVISLVLAIAA